ncbi:resistance-nodulation-cell division divalent metal cation efflux membrane fusion protein CzcB [Metapseudomonas resinovorans]|uniref:efflux RND transporter periplasmic adaptor subunit n=1 Tax=Metapseudomonas resinovorans TaxID=53412 RepID=UPI0009853126|nr:efflux RND transporter periplasmic adaptor subunit [Pseudomonas resinovorans]GLZ88152.1 resistance-nodulation-cell division divalent metal cation efflux membrane fusion protein CzcB [Pseudomonas resinovorans]
MTFSGHGKQWIAIAAVVLLGFIGGGIILSTEPGKPAGGEHGEHGAHEEATGHNDGEHHGAAASKSHEEEAEHADEEHHEDDKAVRPIEGPRGGKLFVDGQYALELAIVEQGVEPQFRAYASFDGKPLQPAQFQVQVSLERLGQPVEDFKFVPENDYLKSDAVVAEPHSFKVRIASIHGGRNYQFEYEQEEGRVRMTDSQLAGAGVELSRAGPARIGSAIQLLGEVRYNGDRTVQVIPRLSGVVEAVTANAGDRVRKGQVLAVISSQTLADQRGELLTAQKRLALAQSTFEREKKLWAERISAEQDYLQASTTLQEAQIAAQSARQKLATLGGASGTGGDLTRFEVRAPIDGMVTAKQISVGETLKEDSPIFTISDLTTVWVEAPVAAKDLGAIGSGQKVTVSANAFAAEVEGNITYVSALVGQQSRSATARIVVDNPKGIWRPGLPVTVAVLASESVVPVAVRVDALQEMRSSQVVFIRYGELFEARPLKLGRSDGVFVEVLRGLTAGEQYAAQNSFVIKAELGKAGAGHDH